MDNLRNLNKAHKKRMDEAASIADKMKKQAEAAAKAKEETAE